MEDFEKLVNQIMADASAENEPLTREEAEEVAKMEIKAKKINNYVRSCPPKAEKSAPRERKASVSAEKTALFNDLLRILDRCEGVFRENIKVLRENKLIEVKINNKIFKIDIIEQRKA
ncbi:MAG: hypothetical protein IJ150_11955 [Bacteroidales bacterium]|nr:hypothetical protein [Bacteroidales bacterium]